MDQNERNSTRFALFCTEVAQCGIALSMQELETIYMSARKLEGWSDKDFEEAKGVQDYVKTAQKSVAMVNKRRQIVEGLTFQLLTKDASIDELDKRVDLIEYVGKAKRIASIMADEFMEPDERLDRVAENGRRVIEHFIEQWKKMQMEPSVEEIKE